MKARSLFLIGLMMTTLSLPAQDVKKFIGNYKVEAACMRNDVPQEPISFQIGVTEDVDAGLGIQIFFGGVHGIYSLAKATVLNDQDFDIFQQQLGAPNGVTELSGSGNIKGDSIFIQYNSKYSNILYQCECKGKKLGSADVFSLDAEKYNVYVDATNQLIVLDEALQNNSLIVQLVNMQGSIVLQKANTGESINISNFPAGAYLLRILQEDGRVIYSSKVLK